MGEGREHGRRVVHHLPRRSAYIGRARGKRNLVVAHGRLLVTCRPRYVEGRAGRVRNGAGQGHWIMDNG